MKIRTIPFLAVLLIGADARAEIFECEIILSYEISQSGEIISEPVLKLNENMSGSIGVGDRNAKTGIGLEVDVVASKENWYRIHHSLEISDQSISFTSTLAVDADSAVIDWGDWSIAARILSCDNTSKFRF